MDIPRTCLSRKLTEIFISLDSGEGLGEAIRHMLSILVLLAATINYHPPSVESKRGQYKQFHPFMGRELVRTEEGGGEGQGVDVGSGN